MKEKEEIKNKAEEAVEEETQSVDNTTEIPVEDGKSELEKANEKIAELEDKYLRQVAEFDNYRRRVMKEKAELILNGGEKVLTEILPIVDDLERAEQQMEQMTDVDAVKQGVELIIDKFIKFLRSQGVQEIDTKDKDFDVNYHEAITMVPSQSDDQKGKVIDCVTKGYTLNDKVIRYAKVVVAN
jgi:molecular chaperone GrpE